MLALQYKTGVYQSELSHHPDEAAHVVTSLMIHDYATRGLGTSPLRFAENYYIHYPKVAFGIWPPVFHATAALWMLLFTRTQTSLLIFIAVQCAVCAATLAMFARRLVPPAVAFGLGIFMILLPAFQNASSLMMVDIFLTVMQLWAMLLLIAFFRSGSMKAAVWFGVCTSLAMLTKGNANALLLSGVFMLLLTRQFSILKRAPIYVAGGIILLVGGPWQVITLRLFKGTVPMDPLTLSRFWMLFTGYIGIMIERLSGPLFLFAMVGLAAGCFSILAGRKDRSLLDIAGAASLLGAIVLFHCIAPNPGPDDRYILPAIPLLVLFAALGIRWVASMVPVPRVSPAVRAVVLTVFCLGWFAKTTFAFTHRPAIGFAKSAAALLPARSADEVALVCSDAWGEGAFITSMALGDVANREHIVMRGSKVLSENPWDAIRYRPFFKDSAALENYLEQVPVDVIVLDLSAALWVQDRSLLAKTIRENPGKWGLVEEIQKDGATRHLQIYRWIGPDHSHMRKNILVRMRLTLGHDLRLK